MLSPSSPLLENHTNPTITTTGKIEMASSPITKKESPNNLCCSSVSLMPSVGIIDELMPIDKRKILNATNGTKVKRRTHHPDLPMSCNLLIVTESDSIKNSKGNICPI